MQSHWFGSYDVKYVTSHRRVLLPEVVVLLSYAFCDLLVYSLVWQWFFSFPTGLLSPECGVRMRVWLGHIGSGQSESRRCWHTLWHIGKLVWSRCSLLGVKQQWLDSASRLTEAQSWNLFVTLVMDCKYGIFHIDEEGQKSTGVTPVTMETGSAVPLPGSLVPK